MPVRPPTVSTPPRPRHTRHPRHLRRWLAVAWAFAALAVTVHAQDTVDWPLVGRQGLLQVVIVPAGQVKDLAAYRAQVARLCPPERTCFVNFYANPSGASATLPLPDAIAEEATARFRRSMKNGQDLFQWSCRLGIDGEPCF